MWNQHTVIAPGPARLTYYTAGPADAPAIVVANAIAMSPLFFRQLAEDFASSHRLITWDYRGFASSELVDDPDALSVSMLVDDIAFVMQAARVTRASFVAWCSGAKFAAELYRARPDLVDALAFVNGTFARSDARSETTFEQLEARLDDPSRTSAALLDTMVAMISSIGEPPSAALLERLHGCEGGDVIFDMFDVIYENGGIRGGTLAFQGLGSRAALRNYFRVQRLLGDVDCVEVLREARVPLLFIAGERDTITLADNSRSVAARCPSAQLHIVPDGTHYCFLDAPTQVHAAIRGLFASLAHGDGSHGFDTF